MIWWKSLETLSLDSLRRMVDDLVVCEKCGEICYLIDVEITSLSRIGHLIGIQPLKKTFKCIKCGTEIEVPPHPKGHFVSEGEMLVWKPGKKENEMKEPLPLERTEEKA